MQKRLIRRPLTHRDVLPNLGSIGIGSALDQSVEDFSFLFRRARIDSMMAEHFLSKAVFEVFGVKSVGTGPVYFSPVV